MYRLISLGLTALVTMALSAQAAWGAERVLLRYRGFSRAISVADLGTLAATGEASEPVARLLESADQRPEDLRSLLTRELSADPVVLDRALNSWPGEWVLDQLGSAIHPVSGSASRQALRSALVLSAADDNRLTLLEVLENYPTPEVVLEGEKIQSAYNRLSGFLEPLSILL